LSGKLKTSVRGPLLAVKAKQPGSSLGNPKTASLICQNGIDEAGIREDLERPPEEERRQDPGGGEQVPGAEDRAEQQALVEANPDGAHRFRHVVCWLWA
jgi:hypothetical protein